MTWRKCLGSAVALKLLFGIPLLAGVLLTALDVLVVLALQGRGFRLIEAFVVTLIRHHCGLLCVRNLFCPPALAGSRPRIHPSIGNPAQQGNAVYRHRNPWRHRDAAQSLSPLEHCADARLWAQQSRAPGSAEVSRLSIPPSPWFRAVHQCSHSSAGRRGLPHARNERSRRYFGSLQIT